MDKKSKGIVDALAAKRKDSLSRHLYIIYWHMHEWTRKQWAKEGWSDVNADHIKLITMIAGGEQLSNAQLAKKAGVTKQAMSQMVALMEKRGVLTVEPDPADSRAKLISLSKHGVDFLVYLSSCREELMTQYTKILGTEKMKLLAEIAGELSRSLSDPEKQSRFTNR